METSEYIPLWPDFAIEKDRVVNLWGRGALSFPACQFFELQVSESKLVTPGLSESSLH